MIDRLVGRPGSDGTGIVAYSLGRLPGDLRAGAIATLDGDPSTLWEPGFGATHQSGDWLEYRLPSPITFDHLDLQIVADGQHSVPTSLTVAAGGQSRSVSLPPLADSRVPGSVVDVPVSFPALTGSVIRITVDGVRIENTPNYYSQQPIAMPLGIAEVGIPGLQAAARAGRHPLLVPGRPADAGRRPAVGDGHRHHDHRPRPPGPGRLPLRSRRRRGGPRARAATPWSRPPARSAGSTSTSWPSTRPPAVGPCPRPRPPPWPRRSVSPSPAVHVDSQSATSIHLTVQGVHAAPGQQPVELVLGQSDNVGWQASVEGGGSLGPPILIDSFANGWRLNLSSLGPAIHDGTLSIVLTWAPQARVDAGLLVSLVAIIACVVLALLPVGRRRRRRRHGRHSRSSGSGAVADGAVADGAPAAPAEAVGADPAAGDAGADPAALPEGATLAVPFRSESPRAPVWVALLTGIITGVVAGAIAAPRVGLVVGVASAVVLLVPRLRVIIGLAAIAAIVGAGWYTAAHQAALHVPADGSWPLSFQRASDLAWAGVVLLGADAVVEVVLRRRRRGRGADGTVGDLPQG